MIKTYLRQVNLCKQQGERKQQGWGRQARVLVAQQVGSRSVGLGGVLLATAVQAVAQATLSFQKKITSWIFPYLVLQGAGYLGSWPPSAHSALSGSPLSACSFLRSQPSDIYEVPTTSQALCRVLHRWSGELDWVPLSPSSAQWGRQTNRHSRFIVTNTVAGEVQIPWHLLGRAVNLIGGAHESFLQEVMGGDQWGAQKSVTGRENSFCKNLDVNTQHLYLLLHVSWHLNLYFPF